MGTLIRRGKMWRAVVRKKNFPAVTKTFAKVTLARLWITETEANLDKREIVPRGGKTLGSILDQYRTDVVDKKTYPTRAQFQLKTFARAFERVDLADCTATWWEETATAWRVAPATRQRYLGHIVGALKGAEILWDDVKVDWGAYAKGLVKLKTRGLIAKSEERDRRLRPGELASLKAALVGEMPMSDIIDFAIALGFRLSEICRVTWADLDATHKMLWVRDRKHPRKKIGNDFNVPLLGDAYDILHRQPRLPDEPRIFPYIADSVGVAFGIACEAAGIDDLVFHDLRHEAISRLFERGYGIPEVALVSGHTDWKSLQRYTNLNPRNLHAGPVSQSNRA